MILQLTIEAYNGRSQSGTILVNSKAIIDIDDNSTGCRIHYSVRIENDKTQTDYVDVSETKVFVQGQIDDGVSNQVVELTFYTGNDPDKATYLSKVNTIDISFCETVGSDTGVWINEGAFKRSRHLVSGSITDLYALISNDIKAILVDSTNKLITVGDKTVHRSIYVDYVYQFGTDQQEGTIYISKKSDGTTSASLINVTGDSIGNLTVSSAFSGDDIVLTLNQTNGIDVDFTYKIRRSLIQGTDVSPEFITEWEIPAGAFTFPAKIQEPFIYNALIDLDDGNGWQTVSAWDDANLTTTYGVTGTKTIKVIGKFLYFKASFYGDGDLLTKVLNWGDVGFTSFNRSFIDTPNLVEIPSGSITGATDVTDCQGMFSKTGLVSFPSSLFSNLINASIFKQAFKDIENWDGVIPEGFFDNNILAEDFELAFSNGGEDFVSVGVTSIPFTLFDKCTLATTFNRAFDDNSSYAGVMPNFSFNTLVTDFSEAFKDCDDMTGNATELWIRGTNISPLYDDGVPDGEDCFENCTLDNQASIPTYWK